MNQEHNRRDDHKSSIEHKPREGSNNGPSNSSDHKDDKGSSSEQK